MDTEIETASEPVTGARAKARAWREDAGLSQKEAAALLGFAQTTLSAIERGTRGISLEQALAYQHHAGIDPKEWVDEQGPAAPTESAAQ